MSSRKDSGQCLVAAHCFLGLFFVALLASCAAPAPRLEMAAAGVAVPDTWAQAAPTGEASDESWWDSFDDPTLSRLIALAKTRNTSVVTAEANLREARALRVEAAAATWPSLTAGLTAQRSRASGASRSSNLFDAGVDASWEADLFGATRHAVAAQDAIVRASAAAVASTRVSIAAEVALAYVDLRSAQARVAVARENLAGQEETRQITRWRLQAGLASAVDEEQASTSVAQTAAAIPALQATVVTSSHALAVLTGQPPAALLSELGAAAPLPRAPAMAVATPAETLRRRPDVLVAEQLWRATVEQVAQADLGRRPRLGVGASIDWTGMTLGSIGAVSAARSLVVSLVQPVFDAGLRQAQLDQREAQMQAAHQAYKAAVLGALSDVETALVALASTREQLESLRSALESARRAALLATQRYASGVIDFQTVLETQRTLLTVQDSVASAQALIASDHVRLYKALGGGWQPESRS